MSAAEPPPSVAGNGLGDPRRRLRFLGVPLLGLLAGEFLLGMALNLYATIPVGPPVAVLESDPLLIVHILVGVLLLGITATALRLGHQVHDRHAQAAGVLGLLSAGTAFLAGMDFTFAGQSVTASYVMSVGFAGLLVSAGLLLLPKEQPRVALNENPRVPRVDADPPGRR